MIADIRNDIFQALWPLALPMVLIVLLACLLPGYLIHKTTTSQKHVMIGVIKTAIAAYVLGAVIFFIHYVTANEYAFEDFINNPIGRANFYLGRSLLMAMLWAPILVAIWISKAQEANRQYGLRMTDFDQDKLS